MLRWIRDTALVAGLAAVGLGATSVQQELRSRDALVQNAIDQKRRIEQVIGCRAAAKTGELNQRGWPVGVDPAWFDGSPPINPLLDTDRPWLEVAPADDAGLLNPTIRIAVDGSLAMFWYNPYQGVVRARVPVMVSDELATQTYNQVNATGLTSIFQHETPIDPLKPHAAGAADAQPSTDDEHPAEPPRRVLRTGTLIRTGRAMPKPGRTH